MKYCANNYFPLLLIIIQEGGVAYFNELGSLTQHNIVPLQNDLKNIVQKKVQL